MLVMNAHSNLYTIPLNMHEDNGQNLWADLLPSAYPSLMYLLTKFSTRSAKDSTLRVTYNTERGAIFR